MDNEYALCVKDFRNFFLLRTICRVGDMLRIEEKCEKKWKLFRIDSDKWDSIECTPDHFIVINSSQYYMLLPIKSIERRLRTYKKDANWWRAIRNLKEGDVIRYIHNFKTDKRWELQVTYVGQMEENPGTFVWVNMPNQQFCDDENKLNIGHELYNFSNTLCATIDRIDSVIVLELESPKLNDPISEKPVIFENDVTMKDLTIGEREQSLSKSYDTQKHQEMAMYNTKEYDGKMSDEDYEFNMFENKFQNEQKIAKITWTCKLCSYTNAESEYKCEICHTFKTDELVSIDEFNTGLANATSDIERKFWTCKDCLYINALHSLKCENSKAHDENGNQTKDLCQHCYRAVEKENKIILANCRHLFCCSCLLTSVETTNELICPFFYKDTKQFCDKHIEDAELARLCDFKKFMEIKQKTRKTPSYNIFCSKCRKVLECYSNGGPDVVCNQCSSINCTYCEVVHEDDDCLAHYLKIKNLVLIEEFWSHDKNDEISAVAKNGELLSFSKVFVFPNSIATDCGICNKTLPPNEGVVLQKCKHAFCRKCVADFIENNISPNIMCPFRKLDVQCTREFLLLEIRDLVNGSVYKNAKDALVKSDVKVNLNIFRCLNPDCKGYQLSDSYTCNEQFNCFECGSQNCIPCRTMHYNLSCKVYQRYSNDHQGKIEDLNATIKYLDEIIESGEAMVCPNPDCELVLYKADGCEYVKCQCELEICWITRGPRWGPDGRGDITGGCKCGVDGKKCHEKCITCH